jgi:hypothetical protein
VGKGVGREVGKNCRSDRFVPAGTAWYRLGPDIIFFPRSFWGEKSEDEKEDEDGRQSTQVVDFPRLMEGNLTAKYAKYANGLGRLGPLLLLRNSDCGLRNLGKVNASG